MAGPELLRLAPREEWPDADFDFAEEEHGPIHASDGESDKGEPDAGGDDGDDWDTEMDLGSTGGSGTLKLPLPTRANTMPLPASTPMFTIRPPIATANADTDDDEGISTIKAFGTLKLSAPAAKPAAPLDEDIESDFALPSDMTQLSLRPMSLHHQSSRGSFEWGEKDHTSSSQSSDAFTSLGFTGSSASSNSTSASMPETETDEDSDELEGLVIPSGLFESGQGSKHLTKMLERKKRMPSIDERPAAATPDPEDDFEVGLLIDDADFSVSRLPRPTHASGSKRAKYERSKSAPSSRMGSTIIRPPSRARKTKSPTNPPTSSMRQLRQLAVSPPLTEVPRAASIARSNTFQPPPTPSGSGSGTGFLNPKSASLRGQKSQTSIKPASPPGKPLTRKASLSSIEMSPVHGQHAVVLTGPSPPHPVQRYEAPTAASRAKSQLQSIGRLQAPLFVPGASTGAPRSPSLNASHRLTLPVSITRQKSRPTINSVFPDRPRATSPLPRPPSSTSAASSSKSRSPPLVGPTAAAPRLLRRPKKARPFGDGTELDGFDDLPTDRDKETRYRVQIKASRPRTPVIPSPPSQPPRSPPRTKAATKSRLAEGTRIWLCFPLTRTHPSMHRCWSHIKTSRPPRVRGQVVCCRFGNPKKDAWISEAQGAEAEAHADPQPRWCWRPQRFVFEQCLHTQDTDHSTQLSAR
jgi:hypothetical protein